MPPPKKINDWRKWYAFLFLGFLMFCNPSILGLHLCIVFVEFFDVAIFIDVLPWIGLYYNKLLHLQVLLLEHDNNTSKIRVGWHRMHLVICITCTSTTSLTWVKWENAQRKLLMWYSTQYFALFASDWHNILHVACFM